MQDPSIERNFMRKEDPFHRGMNRRQAERAFRRMGGKVEEIAGTGERRLVHPAGGRSCRYSGHRKDLPREILVYLKSVVKAGRRRH